MSLTEDLELQIEATGEGRKILWNHNVRIYDEKPTRWRASFRQRTRWAQGHWYVTFKNTGKIFRALVQKRISFWEFVSTLLYMYSLTPYIFLVAQTLLNLALEIFTRTGLIQGQAVVQSVAMWWLLNLPSILLFLYSFIFLYYYADYADNGRRFTLKSLVPNFASLVLNTLLVAIAQVVGLCKHRKQNVWVKTTHEINTATEECMKDFMPSLQASVEQAKEEARGEQSAMLAGQRANQPEKANLPA